MRKQFKLILLGTIAAIMLARPAAAQMGGGMGGMGGGGMGGAGRSHGAPSEEEPSEGQHHAPRSADQLFISIDKFDRAVTEMFKSADTNHDGFLDWQEVAMLRGKGNTRPR